MILPKNGRVIVIDDEQDQAFPLISALSKHNISTTYFDGTSIETMPETKFGDARVVFLDINLNGASQPSWKNERGLIINAITHIIEPNIPYILFIWSVKSNDPTDDDPEKTLFQEVSELFDNELIDYKPMTTPLEMGKSEVFEQEVIKSEGEEDKLKWVLRNPPADTIELIRGKIEEGISQINSIEALLKWENVVSDATSETFNDVVSLALENGELDQGLKGIYYKLAEALWGRQLRGKDHYEVTDKALSMLNHLLSDRIETNIIEGLQYEIIEEYGEPEGFDDMRKARLNSKILLNFDIDKETFPGNIFILNDGGNKEFPFKSLVADLLNIPYTVVQSYIETEDSEPPVDLDTGKYKNENKKIYSKFEKAIRSSITEESIFVNVEMSPICDYAQKKWKSNRINPGILWHEKYFQFIGKADSLYVSPPICFKEQVYRLVLDFRYFYSVSFDTFEENVPIFTIRHSLLVDIQSQLGRHINRPGISALI